MVHICTAKVVLLTGAAMLATSEAGAQARGSAATELREQAQVDEIAEQAAYSSKRNAWLGRIVGQFRIQVSITAQVVSVNTCAQIQRMNPGKNIECLTPDPPEPPPEIRQYNGLGDCIGIGTGPGVNCLFKIDLSTGEGLEVVLRTLPLVNLFGVDPKVPGIRYMQIDANGLPDEAWSSLKGDTVTFRMRCARSIGDTAVSASCQRTVRIYAPSNRQRIAISMELEEAEDMRDRHARNLPPNPIPPLLEIDLQRLPSPSDTD